MALNNFLLVSAFLLVVLSSVSCSHTFQSKPSGCGKLSYFIQEGSLSLKGQDVGELQKLNQNLKELACSCCNHQGNKVGEQVKKKNEFDYLLESYQSNAYLKLSRFFGALLIWNLLWMLWKKKYIIQVGEFFYMHLISTFNIGHCCIQ